VLPALVDKKRHSEGNRRLFFDNLYPTWGFAPKVVSESEARLLNQKSGRLTALFFSLLVASYEFFG